MNSEEQFEEEEEEEEEKEIESTITGPMNLRINPM
jgi:hypothetical protein